MGEMNTGHDPSLPHFSLTNLSSYFPTCYNIFRHLHIFQRGLALYSELANCLITVFSERKRLGELPPNKEIIMMIVAVIVGILGILIILMDAFETIVLPRLVVRNLRFAIIFYRFTWQIWSFIGRRMREGSRREYYLSFYGPLSLLLLMITWAGIFIVAFALIHWGLQLPIASPNLSYIFGRYLYFSGTTFVTLGLGDLMLF